MKKEPSEISPTKILAHAKSTYEKLGQQDPLYAVLTVDKFRHNRWKLDEFFKTGTREIKNVMIYVGALGLEVTRGRVLDFGCGVGRLSQPLAEHFREVVGIDIAESMIDHARALNRHGTRVRYLVNTVDHLSILESDSFDFVYSNLTLQHIPPEASRNYIAEFLRVLRPGAIAIFQVPNGKAYGIGSWEEWSYRFRRQYIRRVWKIIRGRPPYEMHYLPQVEVERIVVDQGGRLVDKVDIGRKPGRNFRYCAGKW